MSRLVDGGRGLARGRLGRLLRTPRLAPRVVVMPRQPRRLAPLAPVPRPTPRCSSPPPPWRRARSPAAFAAAVAADAELVRARACTKASSRSWAASAVRQKAGRRPLARFARPPRRAASRPSIRPRDGRVPTLPPRGERTARRRGGASLRRCCPSPLVVHLIDCVRGRRKLSLQIKNRARPGLVGGLALSRWLCGRCCAGIRAGGGCCFGNSTGRRRKVGAHAATRFLGSRHHKSAVTLTTGK